VKNKDIIELTKTYQRVFKSEDGQTVLSDLEKRCNVHQTSFSNDPHETSYREGQRQVVLFIKSIINKNPKGENHE
jgi:hypothetical protein